MRITGGKLSGRRFKVPPGDAVRPTQDRVRESLFAQLGDRLAGARVLDLFAGSGALGLEAWSRGAGQVWWVEKNPKVFRVLQENVDALCRDDSERPARCLRRDALAGLRALEVDAPFDIILADPPYALHTKTFLLEDLLRIVDEKALLSGDGLFVFEHGDRDESPVIQGWRRVRDRKYGETRISIFKRGIGGS